MNAYTIENARCEYQVNPLGVDAARPRLTWAYYGDNPDCLGAEIRVTAAADPEFRVSGLLYPTDTIPYTIVVDPYGVITVLHHGGGMNMYEVFEGYVKQALEAESPTGVELLA